MIALCSLATLLINFINDLLPHFLLRSLKILSDLSLSNTRNPSLSHAYRTLSLGPDYT